MQIEILEHGPNTHLLTVFNCHFKSKYTGVDRFQDPEAYEAAQALNTIKRAAEVAEVVRIVKHAVDVENDLFVIWVILTIRLTAFLYNRLLGKKMNLGYTMRSA